MPVSRIFIANLYEVLLGRELAGEDDVRERSRQARDDVIAGFLRSGEFARLAGLLRAGEPLPAGLFLRPIGWPHRYWLIDDMPILPETALTVQAAADWRTLLAALAGDHRLMATAGLEPVPARAVSTGGGPAAAHPAELVWSDDRT